MRTLWEGTFREPAFWDLFGHRLVELAEPDTGSSLLDVGTGDGAVLIPAARRVGADGKAVGIDIRPKSVERALRRLRFHEIDNAPALEMNAESLSFEDESFDVVLSGFVGWSHVYDFDAGRLTEEPKAIREMHRVLKPGGLVGISSWINEEDAELMRHLVSLSTKLDIEDVPRHYSKETESGVRDLLNECGFDDLRTIVEERTFTYTDPGEWLEVLRAYGWHPELAQITGDASTRDTFEREAVKELDKHRVDAGLIFRRTVVLALARKPNS